MRRLGQSFESISRAGSLVDAITVTYGVTGDTATIGQDFVGGQGTVTIPAGVSRVTVPIPIINDNLPEPTETFVFSLIGSERCPDRGDWRAAHVTGLHSGR